MRPLAALLLLCLPPLAFGQIPVRHQEGSAHGFLVLRSQNGELLAAGELSQNARGSRVTVHLTFHFKDGSLQEESTAYSQRHNFRLISDHLVQKGPTFPHPVDLTIDVPKGEVTVRYPEDDKEQVKSEHMDLPPTLANGIVPTLLRNIKPQSGETGLAMIVATPKPRLVKLKISAAGEDSFALAGTPHKATRFVVKMELGGLTGIVAPVIGKQPPDTHVWILEGEAPAFLKSEGPQFQDGPIWRIELASPTWPEDKEKK